MYYTLLPHLLVIPVGSPVAINHPVSLVVRLKDEQEPVRGGVLRVRLEQLGEGGEEATTVGHVFNDLEKGRGKEGGRKDVSIYILVSQYHRITAVRHGFKRLRGRKKKKSILSVNDDVRPVLSSQFSLGVIHNQ